MTYENCKRLFEHYSKLGDKEKAKVYEERMKRKAAKLGLKLEEPKDKPKVNDGKKSKR